jgi:hypothetical protein
MGSMKRVEGKDPGIGKGEFAGMPKDVKMAPYPKSGHKGDAQMDDTMVGIDGCINQADGRRNKYVSNQK